MKLSPLERIVMGVAAALVLGTALIYCFGNRPTSVVVVTESTSPSGRVVSSERKEWMGDAGGLLESSEKSASATEGVESSSSLTYLNPTASQPVKESELPSVSPSSSPEETEGEMIDLNTATQQQLDQLPGIGEKRAAAIIAYREEHGPFTKIEQIMNVPGIGTGIFNNIKPYITVES